MDNIEVHKENLCEKRTVEECDNWIESVVKMRKLLDSQVRSEASKYLKIIPEIEEKGNSFGQIFYRSTGPSEA